MNGFSRHAFLSAAAIGSVCFATAAAFAVDKDPAIPPPSSTQPANSAQPQKPLSAQRASDVDEVRNAAMARYAEAEALMDVDDWDRALEAFGEARKLYESIGEFDDGRDSKWSMALGSLEIDRRNYDAARGHYRHALECDIRRLGRPEAKPLLGLGRIDRLNDRNDEAAAFIEQAIAIYRERPDREWMPYALQALGFVRAAQERWPESVSLFQEAGELLRNSDIAQNDDRARVFYLLGFAHGEQRNYAEALAATEEAAKYAEAAHGKDHPRSIEIRREAGELLRKLGNQERRRHLPQEFARLDARFLELCEADRHKPRFDKDRSLWAAFEPQTAGEPVTVGTAPFPEYGGAPAEPERFFEAARSRAARPCEV